MKDGLRFVDCDMHVMEPPDLFDRYLDPEFRDRVTVPLGADGRPKRGMITIDGLATSIDPDLEQIIALAPTLIITRGTSTALSELCQEHHIRIFHDLGQRRRPDAGLRQPQGLCTAHEALTSMIVYVIHQYFLELEFPGQCVELGNGLGAGANQAQYPGIGGCEHAAGNRGGRTSTNCGWQGTVEQADQMAIAVVEGHHRGQNGRQQLKIWISRMVTDDLERRFVACLHCGHPLEQARMGIAVLESTPDRYHVFCLIVSDTGIDQFGNYFIHQLVSADMPDDCPDVVERQND